MKTTFLTLFTIILTFELSAQQTKTETIYFDQNKYNLTASATTILENLYINIKTESFSRIKIIGHTDGDGSDNYNMILSKNRTKTVNDYFLSKGIASDKIIILFYGENMPIAKNENEQYKQQNRRVEIILEKEITIDNDKFEKQAQHFSIPSNKDTTIICNEGTIIKIKANSFVSQQTGQFIIELIDFTVLEYYKISDILLSNLSTSSSGQLLETAGMININATYNNQPLELAKGKTIEISFPTMKKERDMQLFSGAWENSSHIEWKAQPIDKNNSQQIFMFVEEMPKFNGGEGKLRDYLSTAVKYPEQAKELGVQGTVYISFVINEIGEVTEPRVIRGVTTELDIAALEAIKKMPNWVPGKQQGRNVSVQYNIPVKFDLGDTSLVGDGTFKERFEQSYTDSTIQNASAGNILHYVFNTTELGWINCDRFINVKSKINFVVKLDKNIETVKIIFDRYKSILNGIPANGNYTFKGVPLEEKITIVAIKRVDNKPYLSVKETQTSNKVEQELSFQPVTFETLKTEIEKLDKFNW